MWPSHARPIAQACAPAASKPRLLNGRGITCHGSHHRPDGVCRVLPGEPALLPAPQRVLHGGRGAGQDLVQFERAARPGGRREGRFRPLPPPLLGLCAGRLGQAGAAGGQSRPLARRGPDLLGGQERVVAPGHRGTGDAQTHRRHGAVRCQGGDRGHGVQALQLHAGCREGRHPSGGGGGQRGGRLDGPGGGGNGDRAAAPQPGNRTAGAQEAYRGIIGGHGPHRGLFHAP